MQPGGRAGKVGGKYEALWAVRRLLHVLAGELTSVTIEGVGLDEPGVDVWSEDPHGVRHAEQCKRKGGSASAWTIGQLVTDVLANAQFQLDRSPRHRFRLVTNVAGGPFESLSEEARSSDVAGALVASWRTHRTLGPAFTDLCAAWSLSPVNDDDAAVAVAMLKRCDVQRFDDGAALDADLRSIVLGLIDASASSAVAALYDLVTRKDNWGQPLDAGAIWRRLSEYNLPRRPMLNDPDCCVRLDQLQWSYLEAAAAKRGGERVIARPEADQILEHLRDGANRQPIVVAGPPGGGKSGVLAEVCLALAAEDVPFLAVRLDDHPIDAATAQAYGHCLGLPDSPALTLGVVRRSRRAVLVIDQVDAVRWCSAHSQRAWQVCLEMLEQAKSFAQLSVVLACRTFDLERDPLFREWFANTAARRIDVGDLEESQLEHEVGSDVWRALPAVERRLLRRILNLQLWRTLRRRGELRPFGSEFALMQRFWEDVYRRLQELPHGDVARQVLPILTDAMQRRATLTIAEREVGLEFTRGLDALESLGIVQRRDGRVGFGHQAFGDYLIAERLFRELLRHGELAAAVLSWLRPPNRHSLFNRGRLQLLLRFVADAERSDFLSVVETIIRGEGVRFHVKLLTLQVLGEVGDPAPAEAQFALTLVRDENWRSFVLREVLHGRAAWLATPLVFRFVRGWLLDGESHEQNLACWLLRSVLPAMGGLIADCLRNCEARGGDHLRLVDAVLSFSAETECDELFELRLRRVAAFALDEHMHWPSVATAHPERVPRLAATWLERLRGNLDSEWKFERTESERRRWSEGFIHVQESNHPAWVAVGRLYPNECWELLWPPLLSVFAERRRRRSAVDRRERWSLDWAIRGTLRPLQAIESVLVAAGRTLARERPAELWARIERLPLELHRFVARVAMRSLVALDECEADRVLEWATDRLRLTECGAMPGRRRWSAARALLRRFASSAADGVLNRLAWEIVALRRTAENNSIRRRHRTWNVGRAIVPNRVGEAAFFLLSTLPLTRLPDVVRGRHGCLERKFFGCRDRVFGARERGRGGTIVSPVERRRDRLSDRAWAALIEDDTIPEHSGAWRDDGVEESADAFASSLYSAALRDPGRFARLGATVRRVAHGVYLDRLWLTVSGARPGSEVPEAQRPAWRPADACDLERLYWRHDHLRRDGCDRGLCSAVAERPAAGWSDAVIEKLIELCTASLCPRPDDWSLVARVGEVTVQNVETTAINRVRSLAVFALTAVLDEFPDRLDAMESALTSAARDPHPSVRAAMLSALAVVWPLRESLAIELFATLAADPEDQIWATSYGRRLLPFVHSRYVARVHPLLDRMVASPIAEARRFGAERVAAEWVWHGGREESYRLVANSEDPQHRTGVVRVLESDAAAARPSASVGDLIDYFDDQDAEVRRRAGGVFRRWNRENHATMSRLAEPFLRSQAFREDPSRLLFCLGHAPVDLTDIAPTAFAVVRAAHDLMASGVAVPTSQLHVNDDLSRLLLRIYEAVVETRDQALETACLDAWDQYVQTGLPCAQHDLELLSRG